MRGSYTELYVHLVWATWDRLPILDKEIEDSIYAAVAAKCHEMGCLPLEIGGIADHIHVLVQLNPAVAVADLVKEIKGSSSHLATHVIRPGEFFKWQGAYRAFTLRKTEVEGVRTYICRQKIHHASGTSDEEWEMPKEEVPS